jgi:hypothetical protein
MASAALGGAATPAAAFLALPGLSGHQRHSLKGIHLMDSGRQLHAVFDRRARYETIITEHELPWAVFLVAVQSPVASVRL